MIKIGQMWVNEGDTWFINNFAKTGDKFEYEHLEEALKAVMEFGICIDVGAHYGSWTIHLAKKFEAVIAFEPFYANFQCLEKNVEGLENVFIVNNAVGEKKGRVEVGPGKVRPKIPGSNSGTHTIIGEGKTPMVTIDSLDLENVGLIKIDVEGYELRVLEGSKETLKRNRPVVVFEENKRGKEEHNIKIGSCGKFLDSLGASEFARMGKDIFYKF